MGLLIKNGTLVTARDRWLGDVYCRNGQIAAVGEDLEAAFGDEEVDASGQLVFPGGVDPHVHMSLPVMGTVSSDDFETGTAAGLAGGTTTIIDFVHPQRGQSFLDALTERRAEAAKAVCDYGFHMAVTWWGDQAPEWLRRCAREEGIPTFKAYFAYKETVGLEDRDMVRAMQAIADIEGMLLVHAEHGDLVEHLQQRLVAEGRTEPKYHAVSRPAEVEGEATTRASVLARLTGVTLYIVHVTCRQALAAITQARQEGQRVWGETCPQYLLLDDSVYERPDFEGAAYVIAPPIRPRGHQDLLWGALRTGLLQVVATDHCPFQMEQKGAGREDFRFIPGGAAGIEHRLPLLYTYGVGEGRIDLEQFVDLVATRPARLFGLYPRKGSLTVGADADLVIWDPEATGVISASSHHHRCDRSIYEGFRLKGLPSTVIAGGRIRYHDGDLRLEDAAGRYLARPLRRQTAPAPH